MFTVKFKHEEVDVEGEAASLEDALRFVGEFCDRPLVYFDWVEWRGDRLAVRVRDWEPDGFNAWIFAPLGYVPSLGLSPAARAFPKSTSSDMRDLIKAYCQELRERGLGEGPAYLRVPPVETAS